MEINCMKAYWLGQAGFLFVSEDGYTAMIDPYMSDSVEMAAGPSYKRMVPINTNFLIIPDTLIITHQHEDHMDFDTIDRVAFSSKKMTILASTNAAKKLRTRYGVNAEVFTFAPGTEFTNGPFHFCAVHAFHSDEAAIGVVIECDEKKVAHLGDTLFNHRLTSELPKDLDLLILPINGKGDNMNAVDAARLTRIVYPKAVIPIHWDMFKDYGCDVKEYTDLFDKEAPIRIIPPVHYAEVDFNS